VICTFVGDVHGWSDRLEGVIAQAKGELIFLGDLIDRGPDSAGTVKMVRDLCEAGKARCILGNHEFALVRGLGCDAAGIPALPQLFDSWQMYYGGAETCLSYGLAEEAPADALRQAMGDDLEWLASLPWYLQGTSAGRRWIAVHAGFDRSPLPQQLAELEGPSCWTFNDPGLPGALYSKDRLDTRPKDMDPEICVVSGHTPVSECHISTGRILCDTSGGRPGLELSGVIFPEGRVVSSP
jgi:hypothetical protein